MSRCRKGDLAFVIKEFDGCEGNIGKIVRVVSRRKNVDNLQKYGNLWVIKPVSASRWWAVSNLGGDKLGVAELSDLSLTMVHPDHWLLPIRQHRLESNSGGMEVDRPIRRENKKSGRTPVSV